MIDLNARFHERIFNTSVRHTATFSAAPRKRPSSISALSIRGIVQLSSNFQEIEFNFDDREIRRTKISREKCATRGEEEEEVVAKEISFPREICETDFSQTDESRSAQESQCAMMKR